MTNYCDKCDHQDHESNLIRTPSETWRCRKCAAKYYDQPTPVEMVNNPAHYMGLGGCEAIDVIEAFELNFNLGNALKYILRSEKKGSKEENIKKAVWYLNRELLNFRED